VEDDVDVDGELAVDDGTFDKLHVGIEAFGGAEAGVIDGNHFVIGGKAVRDIWTDEARATRDEDAFIVDKMTLRGGKHLPLRFG
jgi:hypothetical protein